MNVNRLILTTAVTSVLGALACHEVPDAPVSPLDPGLPRFAVTLSSTTSPLTSDAADQLDPRISGDFVVYTNLAAGNEDVEYQNVSVAPGTPHTVASGGAVQQQADVSLGKIAFTENDGSGPVVMIYDEGSSSVDPIVFSGVPEAPSIDGGLVAFAGSIGGANADIYLFDLAAGTTTQITATADHESNPSVGGGIITFERATVPGGTTVIHYYDVSSGVETSLGPGSEPHTDGATVVYSGTGAVGGGDVLLHEIAGGTTSLIGSAGTQSNARVDGDILAFDDDSGGNADVVIRHIPSGASLRLGTSASERLGDLDDNRVVYTSDSDGDLEVWLLHFIVMQDEPPPPPVEVDIAPTSLDLGPVEVGSSAFDIVTITNVGASSTSVEVVALDAGTDPSYAITSPLTLPHPLGPGETLDVTITFMPTAVGPASGDLSLGIGDHPSTHVATTVPLAGEGVPAATPSDLLDDLLQWFDARVADGSLIGTRRGRLNAMRQKLARVANTLAAGNIEDACDQLSEALTRTDDVDTQPDFVEGPATAELASRVGDLMETLGCSA